MSEDRTPSKRKTRKSARQQQSDDHKARDAAKTAQRKQKASAAAAKKTKRAANDARAAALGDVTNTTPAEQGKIAALENRIEILSRKNKRLSKAIRRHKINATDDSDDIVAIPKPKNKKFNIQAAMGLENDTRLYTEIQATVRSASIESKIDFALPWKEQEPADVAQVLRVAASRNNYLTAKRFPRHWATSALLQRYINNARGYTAGKANPDSGVSRRRYRNTTVGRIELIKRRGIEARQESSPANDDTEDTEPSNAPRNEGPSHSPALPSDDEEEDDDYDDEDMVPPNDPSDSGSDSDSEGDDEELPMAED
ncbi:hypothetical protein R3P38DRAFT_3354712 [Favolaschia claudopus]|uniref:Uncharacterized protein n=1 Tax=Favolaschia claudopus TaxID=2862362 RepID=A0AAW0BMJ7_9AGAR